MLSETKGSSGDALSPPKVQKIFNLILIENLYKIVYHKDIIFNNSQMRPLVKRVDADFDYQEETVEIKNELYSIFVVSGEDLEKLGFMNQLLDEFDKLDDQNYYLRFGRRKLDREQYRKILEKCLKLTIAFRNNIKELLGWGEISIIPNKKINAAEICCMVLPGSQGLGIGTYLVKKMINICKASDNIKMCRIRIKSENEVAAIVLVKIIKELPGSSLLRDPYLLDGYLAYDIATLR